MTGGSRRKESGNLLAGERHIKEAEEGIARKEAAIVKFKASLSDCRNELESARAEREKLRMNVQENAAAFAALSQKENSLTSLLQEAERDKNEYEALLSRLTQRVDDLQSEVASTAENEDLLNKIREEAAAEASAREAEISKLRQERDALQREYNALQVEKAALISSRQADSETSRRLENEKVQLLKKIEESRAAILQTDVVIEQLKREQEKVALTEEEQLTVSALRDRIAVIEEEKKTENARQTKFQEEKRVLLARQITLGEDRHTCELEISKSETTLENMRLRIDEAYGLSYESAKELRDENYNIKESQSNISSLKHKIAALGPVNQNLIFGRIVGDKRAVAFVDRNFVKSVLGRMVFLVIDCRYRFYIGCFGTATAASGASYADNRSHSQHQDFFPYFHILLPPSYSVTVTVRYAVVMLPVSSTATIRNRYCPAYAQRIELDAPESIIKSPLGFRTNLDIRIFSAFDRLAVAVIVGRHSTSPTLAVVLKPSPM